MNTLINFIDEHSKFLILKIITLIYQDKDLLEKLNLDKKIKKKDLLLKLENYPDKELLLSVLVDLFRYDEINEESSTIFHGHCSFEAFTRNSSLYIIKLSNSFYCIYISNNPIISKVTTKPIPFCIDIAKKEREYINIEIENLSDLFKSCDEFNYSLYLTWNCNIDDLDAIDIDINISNNQF